MADGAYTIQTTSLAQFATAGKVVYGDSIHLEGSLV